MAFTHIIVLNTGENVPGTVNDGEFRSENGAIIFEADVQEFHSVEELIDAVTNPVEPAAAPAAKPVAANPNDFSDGFQAGVEKAREVVNGLAFTAFMERDDSKAEMLRNIVESLCGKHIKMPRRKKS